MSVSRPYAVAQTAILDDLGFPQQTSLDIMGIKDDSSVSSIQRIDSAHLNAVFEQASHVLNDPCIALRVGNGFRVANFETTGNIFSFCKDLNEIIKLNARYQPLAIDIAEISTVIETDPKGQKRFFLDYRLYCDVPGENTHLLKLVFGSYGTSFRWLTWGSAKELKAVYFSFPPPDDKSIYKTVFQCPVFFNQPYNRIEFEESCMSEPLSTHDPVRKAQYIATLESLIESNKAHKAFMESLEHTVRQGLSVGRYSFPAISDAMKISETKLRQDMKANDIQYRDYLEDIRKIMFHEKFAAGLSFTQIALELGYNDQAAFSKAFKKWYNISPTEYKARRSHR